MDRGRVRSMFQGWSQTCFVAGSHIEEIEVEGVADGDDPGGKGRRCGWTAAMYEACFRVSLKHASLRAEILKKLRLKGLQMERILGERGVACGWAEVVHEACFRGRLKHALLRGEIFRKLRLKQLQMEMIVGERGVDVGEPK